LTEEEIKSENTFGPFLSTIQLKNALKIVRKIFPYRDEKCILGKNKPCFNYSIGLCPGTCVDAVSKKDYQKQIEKIKIFLSGETSKVLKMLERDMKVLSKDKNFEEAAKVRDKIYALNHINDISIINRDNNQNNMRIEAYDIAHMSGQNMIGVMVVQENGEFRKDQYKKFIIKTVDQSNDPKALSEVLERRFKHDEWGRPNLVVVDGNKVQLGVAQRFFKDAVSIVKDDKHKAREVLNREILKEKNIKEEEIIKINAEAHRFAIKFFREKLRMGLTK